MTLRPGDKVATGRNSSARMVWPDGTTVQLDENSDPLWDWDGPVIRINVGFGWVMVNTVNYRVRVRTPMSDGYVGSRVVLNVQPNRSVDSYALTGTYTLQAPVAQVLATGQTATVTPDGGIRLGVITPDERIALEGRFARWPFPPLPTRIDYQGPPPFLTLPPRGPRGARTPEVPSTPIPGVDGIQRTDPFEDLGVVAPVRPPAGPVPPR